MPDRTGPVTVDDASGVTVRLSNWLVWNPTTPKPTCPAAYAPGAIL